MSTHFACLCTMKGTVSVCFSQEKLLVFRAECVGIPCRMCWFPVWNVLVSRAECVGFPCGMCWFPVRNVLVFRAEYSAFSCEMLSFLGRIVLSFHKEYVSISFIMCYRMQVWQHVFPYSGPSKGAPVPFKANSGPQDSQSLERFLNALSKIISPMYRYLHSLRRSRKALRLSHNRQIFQSAPASPR